MTIEKLSYEQCPCCKGVDKINEIIDWINNHEKNILPRFKTELLKCLEDREFREKFNRYLMGVFYVHEPPSEPRSGDMFKEPIYPFPIDKSKRVDQHVDTNKTVENDPVGLKEEYRFDKLKQAENELEMVINQVIVLYYNSGSILDLREAYQNWKSLREKN